jgi:hypothetical protein
VLIGGAVGLLLLAAIAFLAITLGGDPPRSAGPDGEDDGAALGADLDRPAKGVARPGDDAPKGTAAPEPARGTNAVGTTAGRAQAAPDAPTPDEGAASSAVRGGAAAGGVPDGETIRRVMSRISTDDSPYISEEGVRDVQEKVREYRGSASLAERIRAMSRGCAEVAGLARANNLKPTLLTYAALAQSESGGDPVEAARRMVPKLLVLRATFGTETANSSLLLVAAYPYPFDPAIGSTARTPHPLYTQLVKAGGQKSTVDTSVARTVWFLREKNSISPEAYNLVVRLLAIGVIAQNPRQHGIDADPVLC